MSTGLKAYLNNAGRKRLVDTISEQVQAAGGTVRVVKRHTRLTHNKLPGTAAGKIHYDLTASLGDLECEIIDVGNTLPMVVEWRSHSFPLNPEHFDRIAEDGMSAQDIYVTFSGIRTRLPESFQNAAHSAPFRSQTQHSARTDTRADQARH